MADPSSLSLWRTGGGCPGSAVSRGDSVPKPGVADAGGYPGSPRRACCAKGVASVRASAVRGTLLSATSLRQVMRRGAYRGSASCVGPTSGPGLWDAVPLGQKGQGMQDFRGKSSSRR